MRIDLTCPICSESFAFEDERGLTEENAQLAIELYVHLKKHFEKVRGLD